MKEKFVRFFEKITPYFERLGNNSYLQAISISMMATLGPVLCGSIAVLLLVLTRQFEFLGFLSNFNDVLNKINIMTIGSMALYVVVLMSYNLVRQLEEKEDGISAAIIGLLNFLIITPIGITTEDITAIPTTWLSAQGVFSAMIVAVITARCYVEIKRRGWTIKMPEGVPPMVSKIFEALLPTFIITFGFVIINYFFETSRFGSFHSFVYSSIQEPLQGLSGSIWAVIVVSIIQQLLWFFGIHGSNVVMPIVRALWMSMDVENLNAITAGLTPPHITGYAFFSVVTWGGTSLSLVFLMLRAKSKQYREVGKVSLVPMLFGIGEPVVFGTPLVLNFRLAVPLITNNAIALLLSYFLIKLGIVARFMGIAPVFGLPLGFYAATQGSISIVFLQLFIQLILGPLLWYPWFKSLDNETFKREQLNS